MGKLLPIPYPGQSMDEYREQLVNFKKNYWSFLKPKEMRPNIIPAIAASNKRKKTKEMSARKLNEHVEEELFNKEKRVITPKITKEPVAGESEVKPVKKKRPYYRKKYNKPKEVEVVLPEPVNNYMFIKGLFVGSVVTAIICHIIYSI
jgi:hypothetical protein